MKKIISAAMGIGLILATTAPVFAGNVRLENIGVGSVVTGRIDRLKTHSLLLNNANTLTQNLTTTESTGNNTANNNVHDGLTAAGNVTKNQTTEVELNTSNVDVDASGCGNCTADDNVTVNYTGLDSNVTAGVTDTKNVTITINNTGNVSNTFTSTVNTGGQQANNNTGNGTALGGDVSMNSLIKTKLNTLLLKLKM